VVNISSTKVVKTPTNLRARCRRRSLPPVLRRQHARYAADASRTARARPGFRRDRQSRRLYLTNNHVVSDATDRPGDSLRQARVLKLAWSARPQASDYRGPQDRRSDLPAIVVGRFFQDSDRRLCLGRGQPVRRRQDGDDGNRQRHRDARTWASKNMKTSSRPTRHQPGNRRRAHQRSRRTDRHQHRHPRPTVPR